MVRDGDDTPDAGNTRDGDDTPDAGAQTGVHTRAALPVLPWWLVFSSGFGACLLFAALRAEANMVAITAFAASIPPIGLLAAIDITSRQLPRLLSYSTLLVVLPMLMLAGRNTSTGTWAALWGAIAMTSIASLLRVASRGALGMGDLHFAPLLGAIAGWFHPWLAVMAWAITAVAGGVVASALLLLGRGRTTRFAYGPLLLFGLSAALLV